MSHDHCRPGGADDQLRPRCRRVTVLTDPAPDEAVYAAETRVPYGKDVTIPEGPAKGFTITEEITGPVLRTA
ncbi:MULTISPECIES: hypothetical protein [unclassified Streptomyces]|uniref:hypothetical protein n=1 Tax=unclassified Streptomyces TaxID=2593676 RepID=UPI0022B682D5|nr:MULTISPECIES: hypothetical protein [unclassified Streptomyces]MCZ7416347.1 hypothetical protein [Streptomyces sp. WMMC897]MCZ7433843.1 hypothetical protein [Streptomyces sp. WMMC1477]